MPLSISNVSQRMLEEIRLREEDLGRAEYPVWIDSRFITGYFPVLEVKRLIAERDDLSYIGKVTRNADRGQVPGFTFVREGGESLNEFTRKIEAERKAAAAAAPVP
jgi:hypothetical protein